MCMELMLEDKFSSIWIFFTHLKSLTIQNPSWYTKFPRREGLSMDINCSDLTEWALSHLTHYPWTAHFHILEDYINVSVSLKNNSNTLYSFNLNICAGYFFQNSNSKH